MITGTTRCPRCGTMFSPRALPANTMNRGDLMGAPQRSVCPSCSRDGRSGAALLAALAIALLIGAAFFAYRLMGPPSRPAPAPVERPLPPPPVPEQVRAPTPPVPVDGGAFVTADDYPTSAMREGRQGTTAFTLRIGTDGRVRTCTITASSGHPDLDAAACRTIARRARFSPARDGNGGAMEAEWSSRVQWKLAL